MIEIKNLCKTYSEFSLQNVSFTVPDGYVTGFIGPNGAGKTTTIKSILGMVRPDHGSIEVFDAPPNTAANKNDIGVVMDLPFYVDEWRIKDVQSAVAPFYTHWDSTSFSELCDAFKLSPSKRIKELSRGMKVKLMLALALSHQAKLLVLDEPTSGLDPVARDELLALFGDYMTDPSHSILFSTHITQDLMKIADYIVFLAGGKVVFSGEKDELLDGYRLVKGDPGTLNAESREHIIGYRENQYGFEGLVDQNHLPLPASGLCYEKCSLDELILFIHKEVSRHEADMRFHKA